MGLLHCSCHVPLDNRHVNDVFAWDAFHLKSSYKFTSHVKYVYKYLTL